MPFSNYKDFKDCVSKNQDKDNPEVYCATIERKIKGEKLTISERLDLLKEDITIPISVGDTILGGKFRNKKIKVKQISKNERGEPLINGNPLMKYRLIKQIKDEKSALQEKLNILYSKMIGGK